MDVPNPQTLEEAREILLKNANQITQLENDKENLEKERTSLNTSIENLRTINQNLYLQLAQGKEEPEEDEPDPEPESLEDYATNKLKGVIRV